MASSVRQDKPRRTNDELPADVSETQALEALRRVLEGGTLAGTILPSLLEHVVHETLAGRADRIKAYTIAVDVLNRGPAFDPQLDSSVRVNMGRLRKSLETHYNSVGQNDDIQITIPSGSYVPVFSRKATERPTKYQGTYVRNVFMAIGAILLVSALVWSTFDARQTTHQSTQRDNTTYNPKINTIAVLSMASPDYNEDQKRRAHLLKVDLNRVLQNGNFLSIVTAPQPLAEADADLRGTARKLNVRFLLTIDIEQIDSKNSEGAQQTTLSLVDGKAGVVVWSEKYEQPPVTNSFNYKLFLRNISFDLNPAYYAAAKNILENEGTNVSSAIELFLISNWVPGTAVSSLAWELERVALAKQALLANPDYLPAHAVLADKLAYLATVDPPSDTEKNRNKSIWHASKVLSQANPKADSLYNIISHKLHLGQIEEAARLATRTYDLDPKNALASFYTRSMVFTCRAATDEQLAEFIEFHEALNRRNPSRWITAHTIGRIEMNRGNYERAVKWGRESEKIFQSLGSGLQLAAALVQTGDVRGARVIVEKQKRNWPNLDAFHFANTVIPRRCGRYDGWKQLRKVYRELAEIIDK